MLTFDRCLNKEGKIIRKTKAGNELKIKGNMAILLVLFYHPHSSYSILGVPMNDGNSSNRDFHVETINKL